MILQLQHLEEIKHTIICLHISHAICGKGLSKEKYNKKGKCNPWKTKKITSKYRFLTRLAVIESKLDDYKKIEDITYRAYNNAKENTKDNK